MECGLKILSILFLFFRALLMVFAVDNVDVVVFGAEQALNTISPPRPLSLLRPRHMLHCNVLLVPMRRATATMILEAAG